LRSLEYVKNDPIMLVLNIYVSEIVLGRFLTRNFVAKLEIIQAIKEADEEDDDSDDGEDYEDADDNIVDISLEEELQPVLQRTRTRNRPKREV